MDSCLSQGYEHNEKEFCPEFDLRVTDSTSYDSYTEYASLIGRAERRQPLVSALTK